MGNAKETVAELREAFMRGRSKPAPWRRTQLEALKALIVENEPDLLQALNADLGKPQFEAWVSDTGFSTSEIDFAQKKLGAWLQPRKVATPLACFPGSSYTVPEPYGVVLIIAPWNYPVGLLMAPLVGAIAAGNCAVLKPSELAPHTAAKIAELVPRYLDPQAIRVHTGGAEVASELLEQRFDYLFFTGGERVGRLVMQAAATHLTPLTLELGGKTPCIIADDIDLRTAAKRVAQGKFFNAGQSCVAPDYVLISKDRQEPLLKELQLAIETMYGKDPKQSPDFARIVNRAHLDRIHGYLQDTNIFSGGTIDRDERYLSPTLVRDPDPDSPLMQEEIFGPVLPVMAVSNLEEAIRFVQERPKPLSLYLFTNNSKCREQVLTGTSSGGACINDCLFHYTVKELPFGGVGASGMGAYHGKASFDTFSHQKSVLQRSIRLDPGFRYPPYLSKKVAWLRRLIQI